MSRSFDRLAGIYRALEFLAFGPDLERTRFCLLERLANCQSILILGEGDGRCLARLVLLAPQARIHCVEQSAGMIARTARRLAAEDRVRVWLEEADALTVPLEATKYDAVMTLFFLDCFTPAQVERLTAQVSLACVPTARWLMADFVIPAQGWRRQRARLWVGLLYAFFRWQTKLSARALPPSGEILRQNGWTEVESREFQAGMLRAALYCRVGGIA